MPSDPEKSQAQEERPVNPWALAFGAGSELVASVLAGYFIGRWLDHRFKTGIWLALAGTVAGIFLGLYQLIRATSRNLPRRR